MKKTILILLIVAAVLVGSVFFFKPSEAPVKESNGNMEEPEFTGKPDLIFASNIQAGDKIQNPVLVRGEARGYWFFEASFPVEVRDGSGNVLGRGIATAEGEWMTEEFVPFFATIEFSPGGNTEGFLAFVKDNPSGLPEHDDELLIPVRF